MSGRFPQWYRDQRARIWRRQQIGITLIQISIMLVVYMQFNWMSALVFILASMGLRMYL